MIKQITTPEEKIAQRLATLVSDLRLDLDQVGIYLARTAPNVSYNRLIEIVESAQFEKENNGFRPNQYRLF